MDCFPTDNWHFNRKYCNLDRLMKNGKRELPRKFSLSYGYIADNTSFNDKSFQEFIFDIYPSELMITETTESALVASYLHLLFTRDESNIITAKLHHKRDPFDFHILNSLCKHSSSIIMSVPGYGVYVSLYALLSLTKLIVSYALLRSTVTNQIVFGQ